MTTKDSLLRFIFEEAPVRGEIIHLNKSFKTIALQHNYPLPLKQLLGEALAVAGLLSAMIKSTGRLTVQFQGKGKLKLLLAQCDDKHNLRGLAKWKGKVQSYAELIESLQQGTLMVTLSTEDLSKNYQGIIAWQGCSLSEAIESYFQNSEQLPTKLWLTADDNQVAGLLLQIIPTRKDKEKLEIPKNLNWNKIVQSTKHIQLTKLVQLGNKAFLTDLFSDEKIRIFTEIPLKFHCTCSRERSAQAIALLGQKEAEAELQGKNMLVVTCDFCNKTYQFDRVDVLKIFTEKNKEISSNPLH